MTKKILLYGIFAGLFTTLVIPFIVPSGMYFPFIAGKGFMFRIIVEIITGLYVILAFLDPAYRPKMSWISKAVVAFGLALLIADALGVNAYKSFWSNYERMEGFVLIVHLALYYFVASAVLHTKGLWNKFWNASLIASVIMAGYGMFQLFGVLEIHQGGVRLDGTFGNASYFAIYLVFHIFLSLMLLSQTKVKWQRWLYGLAAAFEVVMLYFTATRGAILGLIGGLIIAALLFVWKGKEYVRVRKYATRFLIGIAVLLVGFIALRNTAIVQQSPVLSRFSHLGISEFQTQGRYYVWPMALQGFKENPIFGWGQEGFNFVFNKYYDPHMFGQEEWFDRTHDVFLDWLIAGGLVGFLAYASLYVALFYYIWRKRSQMALSEKVLLTGMISAYIFHNIFVFDNLISYMLFFSFLAYVQSTNAEEKKEGIFHHKHFGATIVNYVVIPVSVVGIVLAIYFVNIPAIKANQTLIAAMSTQTEGPTKNLDLFKQAYAYNSFGSTEVTEQLIQMTSQIPSQQVDPATRDLFYNFAKQKIEEKVAETPHDARYLVFGGSFFNRFGQYDTALEYLTKALAESPRKQSILFEMGTSYIGKKEPAKALVSFKQAYELSTSSQEAKIIYAIGALYAKDVQAIKEISSEISPETIINDNRFLNAYANIGDYNSVIVILNARLEKDPTNRQYKLSLAYTYATIGQKQKAIDIIRAAIKDDPTFKDEGEGYIKQIQAM